MTDKDRTRDRSTQADGAGVPPSGEADAPGTGASGTASAKEGDGPSSASAGANQADGTTELARARKDLEAERARAKELHDQLLRERADFDNYRKRMRRDQDRAVEVAREDLLRRLLPVVDNFERGLEHMYQATNVDALKEGTAAIHQQLIGLLRQFDVTPIEASQVKFDPNLHEALTQAPSADVPEGTVLAVAEKGYMLKDRVLRHAKVVVSKAPEAPAPSAEAATTEE